MSALRLAGLRAGLRAARRAYTTANDTSAPLLPSLRADLKAAMRAKDTTTTAVLRSLVADLAAAEKRTGAAPAPTAFRGLLGQRIAAAQAAQAQFAQHGRAALAEAEAAQEAVLRGYLEREQERAGGVVPPAEVEGKVREVLAAAPGAKVGEVVGKVVGAFEGRVVERGEVARMVGRVMKGE